MKIGYARISTGRPNPDSQRDALEAAGCKQVFLDVISGAAETLLQRDLVMSPLGVIEVGEVRIGLLQVLRDSLVGDCRAAAVGRGRRCRARLVDELEKEELLAVADEFDVAVDLVDRVQVVAVEVLDDAQEAGGAPVDLAHDLGAASLLDEPLELALVIEQPVEVEEALAGGDWT